MQDQVLIEALAFGGSGLGRVEGKVVFVPGAVPGDEVRFRPVREKKHFIEGELVALIRPSTERREPPCPVFGHCGGCQWQQLPYEGQVFWKERIFADFFTRQLGLAPDILAPLLTAPSEWGYRSRMQFKCRQSAQGFVMGFYRGGSHFVVDVASCPIAAPAINHALTLFRRWLPAAPCPREIPQLDLAVDDEGRVAAVVHCLAQDIRPLAEYLAPLVAEAEFSLHVQSGRKSTLNAVHDLGDLHIRPLADNSLRLAYAVGGFAQVNLEQNRRLVAQVLAAAGPLKGLRVLDLYCGMGNFSLPLAQAGAEVVGVEDFPPAIERARGNAQAHGLAAAFFCRPVEGALAEELAGRHFDLVILDPPRSGAKDAVRALMRLRPRRILYVSCDPATLVRDLKPLIHNGYRISGAQGIDLFPQTYHLESLTCLETQI